MPHTTLTVKQAGALLAKTAAAVISEKAQFINSITIEKDSQWVKDNNGPVKPGSTVKIRKPFRPVVRSGATFSGQDLNEDSVALAVTTQKGVDINGFTSAELTTDIAVQDFAERIIMPAAKTLAAVVDSDVMTNLKNQVYNFSGTPGTTPNAFSFVTAAQSQLDRMLCPTDDRTFLADTDTHGTLVDALKGLFQSTTQIKEQYEKGVMGTAANFDWMKSMMIPVHTNGTQGGVPLVNGASQSGTSLITDAWTAGATIKAGTVFTIAAVATVHPNTKVSYGATQLQCFVVTADVTADGSGNATLPISPAITATLGRQNVSALPADNAALTLKTGSASTAYAQNLAYHKSAAVFCSLPLFQPKGVHMVAEETVGGITCRILEYFDGDNDKLKTRLDILYGYALANDEWIHRVTR